MKIVISNTSRGAYNGVIEQLKINRSHTSKNIIIGPDRFIASLEREVIKSLDIDGTFDIDIMSFTRLANKLIGSDIAKCLTPEGSVMLIGKVIGDLKDRLEYYGKVALQEGFASELYAALTAIRNSGLSSSDLLKNEKDMRPTMRAKVRDIALIYDGYLNELEGKHSDSSTRLYSLAEYINNNPQMVATTNFYCTDIYDFSHPEIEILRALASSALSLTVGAVSGGQNDNKRIYPNRTIEMLKGIVKGKPEIIEYSEELCPQMKMISSKLFAYVNTKNARIDANGKVALRVAKDVHDEIKALAVDIKKHIVEEGGRYKDYEVYVSDMETYHDEIEAIFNRYNIPHFIDKNDMLIDQAKTRYLLDAIQVVRSSYRRREVLNFVKNPLFAKIVDGGEEDIFLFENYCLKYNIDYSRFKSNFELYEEEKFPKPQLIYQKNSDKVRDVKHLRENEIPNNVRKSLIKALKHIDIEGKENIKTFVEGVRLLLKEVDSAWQECIEELSIVDKRYEMSGEQVDNKLNSVLDEIENVLDYSLDILQFESIVKSMLKTLKIALVPTYADCVIIGDKNSKFMGEHTIYVLGANNNKLPSVSSGGVVLSQKDEETLSLLGVEITPNEKCKLMSSMYDVLELMVKPKVKLVISYPESANGVALRPSTIVSEIQNMFVEKSSSLEIERVDLEHFRNDMEKAKYLFSTKDACYFEVVRNMLSNRADVQDRSFYSSAREKIDKIDKDRMENSYREPERIDVGEKNYISGTTSVSRLETFYRCPYQHYFNYILSLKKRKDGEFEGTENGTILHHILERFYKDYKEGKLLEEDIPSKVYDYFEDAIKENNFERLLKRDDARRKLYRVRDEGVGICKELFEIQKHSKFAPWLFEAKIGEREQKQDNCAPNRTDDEKLKSFSLKFDGKEINLKGTVDRIDRMGDNFLVIDYKTYKSADLTFQNLYYGEKVQLYIYMRAIEESFGITPSGVFYLPIFASFCDEGDSRFKFNGMTSNSMEMLKDIDDRIEENPKDAIAPYVTAYGKLKDNVHMDAKSMDLLGDYAVAIATKGAKEIADGYIKPAPLYGSCEFCSFEKICAYKDCKERKTSSVSAIDSFNL